MNGFDPSIPVKTEEDVNIEGSAEKEAEIEITQGLPEPSLKAEAGIQAIPLPVTPIEPIPIPVQPIRRAANGRYRCRSGGFELELRTDIDGMGITRRISGDFYTVSGSTVTYFGSFIVHSPRITITTTQAVAEGLGTFTWSAGAPIVRVTIPRNYVFVPPAAATVQFKTLNNQNGASYVCSFESGYFRTVDLEQDREVGVTPFVSYNTGSLPSGGAARTLSVVDAYAEAGIQMRDTGRANVMNTPPGSSWSDAELHAAM